MWPPLPALHSLGRPSVDGYTAQMVTPANVRRIILAAGLVGDHFGFRARPRLRSNRAIHTLDFESTGQERFCPSIRIDLCPRSAMPLQRRREIMFSKYA